MNPYNNNFSDKIIDAFKKLNKFQKEAVLNEDSTLLLKANVGSGKTTVLIQKILYLHLIKKIPLEEIIVLTFTNKAANEILERFVSFGIPFESSCLYFGTFHSVAKKILDSSIELSNLGYKSNFSIIDTEEYIDFLEDIIKEHKLNIKYKNKLNKRLEQSKKGIFLYGTMKNKDDIELLIELSEFNRKLNNLMTFDDLINNVLIILKKFKLNMKIQYVIVDEFQDSNIEQIEMINYLLGEKGKLFAVGDQNQTIYTWRGSKINIFDEFNKFRSCNYLSLPVNYRSTSTILDLAKVFLNDSSDLNGVRERGDLIQISKHYNDFNEALYIVDKIKELSEKGYRFNEICILYRKQSQSNIFIDILKNEKIPFEISIRKSIKDIPVLSWLVKLFKASINEVDKFNFMGVLLDKDYGLNVSKSLAIKYFFEEIDTQIPNIVYKIKFFTKEKPLIDDLYNYFELDKYLKPNSANYENDRNCVLNFLSNLKLFISKSSLENFDGIKEYINNSTLFGTQIIDEKINVNENSVKFMTLHSSKGLEFSYVFIIGVNEGLIPLRTKNYEEDEGEEKRLFFVGVTRAKNVLELSYQTSPSAYGVFGNPSNYINLIPNHLIKLNFDNYQNNLSLRSLVKEVREDIRNQNNEQINEIDTKIYVNHHHYGDGHILSFDEGIIKVLFDKYGEKEFIEGLEDYKIVETSLENVGELAAFENMKITDLEKELERIKNLEFNRTYFGKEKPSFDNEDMELIINKARELFPELERLNLISHLDSRKKYKALKILHSEYLISLAKWDKERNIFMKEQIDEYNDFEKNKENKIREIESKILEILTKL